MCEVQLKLALKPNKNLQVGIIVHLQVDFGFIHIQLLTIAPYQTQGKMAGDLALKHLWQHATAEAMPKV